MGQIDQLQVCSAVAVEANESLLYDLVSIPSVSGEEGEAVRYLAAWMGRNGFEATVDEAGNAVGILEGESVDGQALREIVLLGHIDTVPGHPPVEVREGRLYGRGAVDAKGPLAAFACAAALAGARPGWRVVVVGAVEEEAATSKGARHIAGARRPDLAVIGEPSGWQRMTLGYKGRLLVDATVRQSMAHRSGGTQSAPEAAVAFWNAVVARVAELNADRPRAWDQVLPTLRAFSSHNDGLAETAHLELGFRLPPNVGPEALKALLTELAGPVELRFSGEESAYRGDKNNALVRSFVRSVRENGGEPSFVLKTGTSDMNVAGPVWQCPILAYGPGDSTLDHTPEEHVDLDEWRRGVGVLACVLEQLPDLT